MRKRGDYTMSGQGGRIGIMTHYYKTRNYGGALQAYAICRYLKDMGFNAEQICYVFQTEMSAPLWSRLRNRSAADIVRGELKRIINRLLKRSFDKQAAAMDAFGREEIPHNAEVYTKDTIRDCRSYDIYITGSDQVWNPNWYHSAFFLEFVPEGKVKIAYAASIGHVTLTPEQTSLFCESLRNYTAVSVREKDAVELLAPLSPVPVEWALDPVLLLTREQWDKLCADRIIHRPYLFCYFLGDDMHPRQLAAQLAKKRKLKLVSIPHIHGVVRKCDMFFGDIRLSGVSPKGFISLIKYADYIFTDSFHAAVFSEIYRKEYAVFRRNVQDTMTSRIYSVTSIFEDRERFCDTAEKETLAYIESLPPMEQEKPFPLLESMREKSCTFLKTACRGYKTQG